MRSNGNQKETSIADSGKRGKAASPVERIEAMIRDVKDAFRKRPAWSCFLLLHFIAFTIFVFHHYRYLGNDDVFITLRYSYNVAHTGEFVFNPGEHVLGTTTPFLALLVGVFGKIFSPLELVLIRILQISLVVLAVVTWRIGKRQAGRWGEFGALFVPWILAADRILIHQFGMETPVFLLLMALVFLSYENNREILCGILLGFLVLTRPEGMLAAPILLVAALLKKRLPWKGMAAFALLYGVWVVYAMMRFGHFLPNSLSAKVIQGTWAGHFTILSKIGSRYWGWYLRPWLILGTAGFAISLFRKPGILHLFGAWAVLCLAGYTIAAAPDYAWYYLPIFWVIYLYAGNAISEIGRFLEGRDKNQGDRKRRLYAVHLLLGALLVSVAFKCIRDTKMELRADWYLQGPYKTGSIINANILPYRHFGEWIDKNTRETAELTCIEIGILGYYGKRRVIDLAGLINPEIFEFLEKEKFDWWIRPYKLPKLLVVHIPVWKTEGIDEKFLRFFYRPVMFEADKGLFILKTRPEEYNFNAELRALSDAAKRAKIDPSRANLDQWIAFATYLQHERSLHFAYKAAYRRFPENRYYRAGLAESFFEGPVTDYEKAEALYRDLYRDFPDYFDYLKYRAESLVNLDRGEEAIPILEQYARKNPTDPRGFVLLSRLHRLAGDPLKSMEAARKCIDLEPEIFWHYRTMALACEVSARPGEAIEYWNLFLEKHDDSEKPPDLEDRFRALRALKQGRPVPEDIKSSDRPTSPRLSVFR